MLDPKRIGLNAESIGFQKRLKQDIDYDAFQTALQTDYNNQGSAVQVRREKATPVSEIHVMGGERAGFQSNDLMKTIARQERQINGYPLRHFDAANPAVMLPKKYGGFPLYNRNQTEYPELVSVFTEPMSAPLQRNTELLSRQGKVAISNSLTTPYSADGFIDPMKRTYDQLQQNQNEFKQRQHLQKMSETSRMQKFNVPTGSTGIFISKNGQPMSGVSDQISDELPQFAAGFASQQKAHLTKIAMYQQLRGGVAGEIQIDAAGDGDVDLLRLYADLERRNAAEEQKLDNQNAVTLQSAQTPAVAYIDRARLLLDPNTIGTVSTMSPEQGFTVIPGNYDPTGMQAGNLSPEQIREYGTLPKAKPPSLLPLYPSTKRGKKGKKYQGAVKNRWLSGDSESAMKYKEGKAEVAAQKRVNMRLFKSPYNKKGSPLTPSLI